MWGLRAELTRFCGNSKVAIGSENLIISDKSRHWDFLSRVLCDLPPLSQHWAENIRRWQNDDDVTGQQILKASKL